MSLYDDPVSALDPSSYLTEPEHLRRSSLVEASPSGGLGSLADELGGDFGNYDDEYEEDSDFAVDDSEEGYETVGDNDAVTVPTTPTGPTSSSPSKAATPGHLRRPPSTSDYDGSDYGDPGEFAEAGVSAGLEEKLTQIETLALRSRAELHTRPSSADAAADDDDAGTVQRVMVGLQQLPPQSSLETNTSRLITAHAALSSHVLYQTGTIRDLTFSISPTSLPPDETSELVSALLDLIPRPTLEALTELNALHGVTADLIAQLAFLSDSLHMARQSSMQAARKLRVARDTCHEWKNELETVEKAIRWIEDGDWDARCRRREAGRVCSEVTGGFEDVCRGFEEKLRAQSVTA